MDSDEWYDFVKHLSKNRKVNKENLLNGVKRSNAASNLLRIGLEMMTDAHYEQLYYWCQQFDEFKEE